MSVLNALSSDQLLARLLDLVHRDRKLEADLIAHLAEVDARRLYLREGCSSMFAYCVEVLRFAEAVAYKRIAAGRAARRYPEVLIALRKGDLHLTAVSLLAPQLTAGNVTELLAAARHRTADEIRRMLADRQPKPDVVSTVRRLSGSSVHPVSSAHCVSSSHALNPVDQSAAKAEIAESPAENERGLLASPPVQPGRPSAAAASAGAVASSCAAAPSCAVASSCAAAPSCGSRGAHPRPPEPLGEGRYSIRFTADRELHAQIRELRALMRHQIPDGDVGKILAKAIAVLLKQVRARKFGACSTPRVARSERIGQTASVKRIESAKRAERAEPAAKASPSRQIPAAIRRAVSKRDGERCTFVSATGRRCGSRDFLEFHHREPWARQRSHAIDGITLRCRAHNQYEAERDLGAKHMQRFRRRDESEIVGLLPESSTLLPESATLLRETAAPPSRTAALLPKASALLLGSNPSAATEK